MSVVGLPGFLKGFFESFRNAVIYSIVYIAVIWVFAYYLGFLGSREPFAVIINGLFIFFLALFFGFGTEYGRLWLKYRNIDFSRVRPNLHELKYALLAAAIMDFAVYLLGYLLRLAKIMP